MLMTRLSWMTYMKVLFDKIRERSQALNVSVNGMGGASFGGQSPN
jgi:hypothetical protein